MKLIYKTFSVRKKMGMLKNSIWAIGGNILQLFFLSLFFVVVARKFSVNEFAQFLIANSVYQLIAAFSSMGLGQWFIRQYLTTKDAVLLTGKFFKIQLILGLLFYFVNLIFTYTVYPDGQIQTLSIIMGANILFDNLINAIKNLNIVKGRQDKTAMIMVADSLLKLSTAGLLFIGPFSVTLLALLIVAARLLTLSLFLKIGIPEGISLRMLYAAKLTLKDFSMLILKNWRFVIIGSISIIYWRVGNIIISKTLALSHVAEYELAYRIFSIFQILPVIAAATIFSRFVQYVNNQEYERLKKMYSILFVAYTGAAILAYAFIYSFSELIMPFVFGNNYPHAAACLREMFLAFLVMPTVLLQANLIVALGLEHKDMQFNIASLFLNILCCLVAVHFYKSLTAINYAIFLSLIVFHILQDILLFRRKMITLKHCALFYGGVSGITISFQFFSELVGNYLYYLIFMAIASIIIAALIRSDYWKKGVIYLNKGGNVL